MVSYKIPKHIRYPFVVGEIVEVCDRQLKVMGEQRVVYAGKRIVRTDCGRAWRATTGWFVGSAPWPFPSIRHKRNWRKPRAKTKK